MQVLLKHSQSVDDPIGAPKFILWARFEIDEEEEHLINRYRVRKAILDAPDDTLARMFSKWIGVAGFFLALFIYFAFQQANRPYMPPGMMLPFGFSLMPLFWGIAGGVAAYFLAWNSLRQQIRVDDLLRGRTFKAKYVTMVIEKEEIIQKMAVAFRHLLEVMRTWNETKVLEVEVGSVPVLHVLEPPHEAA
jgi:Arc/MetJ family transcription regulator